MKYSNAGVLQWTIQTGTSGYESSLSVALSPDDKNAYITGYTDGSLHGKTHTGGKIHHHITISMNS